MSAVLEKLIASEVDAREYGFDWTNREMIIDWIISEAKEVLASIEDNESNERIQEEIGDVLHAAISLCLYSGFDIEETLEKTTKKFDLRMHWLKAIAKQRGLDTLNGQSEEFMLDLWSQAKLASKS